ncbi:DUF4233 domain-containing protein [Streptomyces hoynatensis]|uniref:DUF4233 domain-containing protein n=1 Tax=Streptomyces hoynatensis TaxID=1141874 RepID=A0A3A9YNT3_9ACTN|nr:DUF4233 domain-containing protein [Streptomyces hoynatensis]RKN37652.1 DUF4233 domain-containing protein [Streptomyces hoynatensis]
MRTLCASTLAGEFVVIGLAGLATMRLSDGLSAGTVWWVSGVAMALCLLLCGLVGRRVGVPLGWALQVALVAAGFVLPVMFGLGAVFAGLWWASVHFGRQIDEIRAARAAAAPSSAPS